MSGPAPLSAVTGLPVVAMVGGGQLARMTHQAAVALGQSLRVLAAGPDESAALVAADVRIGDHATSTPCAPGRRRHRGHLRPRARADRAPARPRGRRPPRRARARRRSSTPRTSWSCAGRWPRPGSRSRPGPRSRTRRTTSPPSPTRAGWPVVLKTPRGGYDGKGVFVVHGPATAADLLERHGTLLAEERVPMVRELSAQVARSPFGQVAVWPVVETVQRDGVCAEVLAPAPGLCDELARPPRRSWPSGSPTGSASSGCSPSSCSRPPTASWSTSWPCGRTTPATGRSRASRTSQFEQHLRAVLDYPLGVDRDDRAGRRHGQRAGRRGRRAGLGRPGLDERIHHLMAHWPDVKLHWYGKGQRPGRKLGHVTALGDDLAEVRARAVAAARVPGRRRRRPRLRLRPSRAHEHRGARHERDPIVGIVMGSDSDWPIMRAGRRGARRVRRPVRGARRLRAPHAAPDARLRRGRRRPRTASDHRRRRGSSPPAGDGRRGDPAAGHRRPRPLDRLDGLDSLLSIVQMPAGVPVATVGIGGGRNAGLLAVRILAAVRRRAPRRRGPLPGRAGRVRRRPATLALQERLAAED